MKTILALALLLVACSPAGSDSSAETTGADFMLKVESGGGFVPVELNLAQLPTFALFADGRLIVPGPQILIYPGPALPNLQERSITPPGLAAIRKAAAAAGLDGPDRNFDQAARVVADLPTTTFTVVSNGKVHKTSVYGFDYLRQPEGSAGLSKKQAGEIAALARLADSLTDLESWLPPGSVGKERPFKIDGMRVFASPGGAQPEQGTPRPWPLDQPLGELGSPASPQGYRCGVVRDAGLDKVLQAAAQANQQTIWTSAGISYTVVFRPLLPGESGCPPPS